MPMLLEEALAGHPSAPGANQSSTPGGAANVPPPLSPHEAALAVLSFVRDELPAGGTPAEKRFVRLFPLVIDRAFGTWDVAPAPPEGSPRGSPGGGVRSPPVSSPGGSARASPRASPPSAPSPAGERHCRHAAGGWFGLPTPPPSRGPVGVGGRGVPSPPRSAARAAAATTTSPDQDPILRLLRAPRARGGEPSSGGGCAYAPTLLDALSVESFRRPSVRFKFPLAGLAEAAKPLVEDWKACFWDEFEKEAARVAAANAAAGRGGFGLLQDGKDETPPGTEGKENATRILMRLLAGPPGEQLELRSFFQWEYQQKHQPQGGHHGAFGNLSSPVLHSPSPLKQRSRGIRNNFGHQTPNRGGNASVNNEPNLELTMLEFYLLLFVRFPLANMVWETQTRDHHERQRRVGGRKLVPPYGQRLHAHLFQSYLIYFLPQGRNFDERMLGMGVDCFDASRTIETCASFARTSELFLRLIIELWVEGPNVAPTTQDAGTRYRRVRGGVLLSASQPTAPQPSLGDSLELAQPSHQPFVVPPPQVQSYVLKLVRHLVSDRSVRDLVQSVSARVQRRQRDEKEGAVAPPLVNEGTSGTKNSGRRASSQSCVDGHPDVPWCLPPALTAAQPSLFNYVRMGLACGAIHDKSSAFHWALEVWLAWLEPWNYVMKRRAVPSTRSRSGNAAAGGSRRAGEFLRHAAATVASHRGFEYYPSYVQPKPMSPSAYSAHWEAYILANVHFYTVPLAVFLKRARELDFASPAEHPRSLALVLRVLRVYSAAVVNVLNGALNKRADALSMSLFAKHRANMQAFCPPDAWKLAECHSDATNLLEEVFSQHQKHRTSRDFFERLEARLNAMFAGKSCSDEAALENLLSRVQYVVGLPRDYRVLPEEPQVSRGSGLLRLLHWGRVDPAVTASFQKVPDRGPDGLLTDLGRQQIYSGQRKCNPFDVTYIGDPMLARVKSYEIPTLVGLTIGVSNYLNRKLGFTLASEGEIVGGAGEDALSRNLREMEQYQKVMFRINLRFLADYRNIIFIAMIWWLRRVIFSTN